MSVRSHPAQPVFAERDARPVGPESATEGPPVTLSDPGTATHQRTGGKGRIGKL